MIREEADLGLVCLVQGDAEGKAEGGAGAGC